MNRRQFINKSAALIAAGSWAGTELFAAVKPNKGRIGIQTYSIRDEMPNDFTGSFKKLSAMGYSSVEPQFDGDKFFGRTLKELSIILKDMGMTISSAHTGSGLLPEDTNTPEWDFWRKSTNEIKSGGGKWVVYPSLPGPANNMDDLKRIVGHFNRVGELCKKVGLRLAFHNHYEVFGKIENETVLDFLIENTDPKLVFFQLDLGHTVNGGGDCVHYIRDYPGRIPLWHASDFDLETRKYTEVGKGSVPYATLFEMAKSSGLEHLIVEQEAGGFPSCKVDFDYLKQYKWTKV
jgi:sugar phosphate isomerase/epimerase